MPKHKFTPLPRDLVLILRTEARNQRTPPVEYFITEDGGRMVHWPEPDIAMAELLEEAAAALAEKNNEIAALRDRMEKAEASVSAEMDGMYGYDAGGIDVG